MGKLNNIVIVNKTKCYVDLALTDMQWIYLLHEISIKDF